MANYHYLICYDVQTQWVRYRVDKVLSGYGERVQKRVFECRLTDSQLVKIRVLLNDYLKPGDKVNYYRFCDHCVRRRLTQGEMPAWQSSSYEYIS